jgi:hypothetical protein
MILKNFAGKNGKRIGGLDSNCGLFATKIGFKEKCPFFA